MSDDDLRGRFRRDFTNEVIRPSRPSAPPAPKSHVTDLRRPEAGQPKPAVRPVLPADSPTNRPEPVRSQPKAVPAPTSRSRGRRRIIAASIVVIGLAGGSAAWYTHARAISPVPASVISSLNFPVLYPSKLPNGYAIKQSSFSTSPSTLIYAANNAKSGQIAFSVQPRPANFDFSSFYKQGLGNASTFDTPAGQAAIGKANGNIVGSLATGQSWVLISAPSGNLQFSDLRLILDNLKSASNK